MNWDSIAFDWNHVRAFLATAEKGNFTAAAKALGLTQPTLGRQVAAFEEELGLTLFERHGRSVALTNEGRTLLAHVKDMGEAAMRLSLAASGQQQSIDGRVSITASDMLTAYQLPKVVRAIRAVAPSLEIELIATNAIANIQQREADIAIRHIRPDQPDLIAKLLKHSQAHLYASKAYVDQFGLPKSGQDLKGHLFIGFDKSGRFLKEMQSRNLPVTQEMCGVISEIGVVAWKMAQEGLGICAMSDEIAILEGDMVQILPDLVSFEFPLWLTTHAELHSSRRIRLVFDMIADALS